MALAMIRPDADVYMARIQSYSWWNDYVAVYNRAVGERNPAYLEQFISSASTKYADWNAEGINSAQGGINWINHQNEDKKLLGGLVTVSPETWEDIGDIGATVGTAGLVAGAAYAGYIGFTGATAGAGATGEIASATGAVPGVSGVGGAASGTVSGIAEASSVAYAGAPAIAGAAEVYGGTESLVYGGMDVGADYAAATVPSRLASAGSYVEQIKGAYDVGSKLYSVGSKIYSLFTGGDSKPTASAPLNGYAPSLINPLSTGGMYGSIYPAGGEFGGGPLAGFGADQKSTTLADFLKSGSGLAMFVGIGLLIAGLILFMRR